jgi:hypothetical protein
MERKGSGRKRGEGDSCSVEHDVVENTTNGLFKKCTFTHITD